MPGNCKTCASPSRAYIEAKMEARVPYRLIVEELQARGEHFNVANLSNHKPHIKQESVLDDDLGPLIQELREEARMAPPTVGAAYYILIKQLEGLHNAPSKPDVAIKAAEAIARITGMRTQQNLLLAFAERHFNPQLPSTTVKQLEAS